jgi:hypothetical protein
MKRTEIEKRERELKRHQKKTDVIERKIQSNTKKASVGEYINDLFSLFRYDNEEIFNAKDDIKILEVLEEMKNSFPEKQWDNIIRKAVKKTNITNKEKAVIELKELIGAS